MNDLMEKLQAVSNLAVEQNNYSAAAVIQALIGAIQNGDEALLAEGCLLIIQTILIPKAAYKNSIKIGLN